jgi:amino acid adenylation domain-containing protein
VAVLLGVLKAGGAFVPLDPAYPQERLRDMLADAGVRRVVADRASAARLSGLLAGRELVLISEVEDEPAASWAEPLHPAQLAYVIYTSGSTGRPKGVAISHGALSLHLDDYTAVFGIDASDKVLQFSTVNFDAAMEQLLPALTVGGRVVMRGPGVWDWDALNRRLAEEEVTLAYLPTGYWQQWLHHLPAALPALRRVTVGGEALPGDALRRWRAGPLGRLRFENTYGPTEATITTSSHVTSAEDEDQLTVPIGRAWPARRARLLDADGNAVPAGGLGELCFGGDSLARGYLHRPGLTAERFVPDPFGAPGSRLYRTGDLCRQRPDGTVAFLGRLDDQVKLRGYRIELGEIAAALRQCAGVREALAVVKGEGDARHLVGYVVGETDGAELRRALERRFRPTWCRRR